MASGCKITFENALGMVDDATYARVESLVQNLQASAKNHGIELKTAMQDLAAGRMTEWASTVDNVLHKLDQDHLNNTADDVIRKLQQHRAQLETLSAVEAHAQNMAKRAGRPPSVADRLNALRDRITTGIQGALSMESHAAALSARYINQTLIARVAAEIDTNFAKVFRNLDEQNVIREWFGVASGSRTPVTKDGTARKLAEIVTDMQQAQRTSVAAAGIRMPARQLELLPHMDWNQMQKLGKDSFIKLLGDALEPNTHGEPAARALLAESIWDNAAAHGGNIRWNLLSDQDVPTLRWANADSFMALRNAVSTDTFMESLLSSSQQLIRMQSGAEILGPDSKRNLDDMISHIVGENRAGHESLITAIQRDFRAMTDVTVPANQRLAQTTAIIKNLTTANSLGGTAVLSAFTDPVASVWVMNRLLDIPLFTSVSDFLAGATSKESRRFAELVGTYSEGMLDHLNSRMGHAVDAQGNWVRRSSDTANFVLNISGLNVMTQAWKAGSTNVLFRQLGDAVGKPFATLPDAMRRMMERYGISELDWNGIPANARDDRGRLDIYQLPEQLGLRITGFVKENVDTATLTAGMRARRDSMLGLEPGSVGQQLASVATQFSSFGHASWRKWYQRAWYNADSNTEAVASLAALALPMMVGTAVAIQAREYLKGNKPYAWDDAELVAKVVAGAGLGGIYGDLLMKNGGSDLLSSMLGRKEFSGREVGPFLGPTVSNILNAGLESTKAAAAAARGESYDSATWKAAQNLLQTIPGQNLWQTVLLYRAFVLDNAHQALDPVGYQRAQIARQRDAANRVDGFFSTTPASSLHNELRAALR